jgi:uncharacterized membrane protein
MDLNKLHYLPLTRPSFSIVVGIFLILLFLIQINALRYTYTRLSLSSGVALLVLFGSLVDSYFNIRVTQLPEQRILSGQEIDYFGIRYVVRVIVQWPRTLVAINIGGAVIPTLVSAYLFIKYRLWVQGAFATACVAALCYWLAIRFLDWGSQLPVFVPVAVTVVVAMLVTVLCVCQCNSSNC